MLDSCASASFHFRSQERAVRSSHEHLFPVCSQAQRPLEYLRAPCPAASFVQRDDVWSVGIPGCSVQACPQMAAESEGIASGLHLLSSLPRALGSIFTQDQQPSVHRSLNSEPFAQVQRRKVHPAAQTWTLFIPSDLPVRSVLLFRLCAAAFQAPGLCSVGPLHCRQKNLCIDRCGCAKLWENVLKIPNPKGRGGDSSL